MRDKPEIYRQIHPLPLPTVRLVHKPAWQTQHLCNMAPCTAKHPTPWPSLGTLARLSYAAGGDDPPGLAGT